MTDLPIFNPAGTWMDRIDNGLLMRYWKKKGCPGRLILTGPWGVTAEYQRVPFGILRTAKDSTLHE